MTFLNSGESFTEPKTRVFVAVYSKKFRDPSLCYVDTIPECDGRTDRRTDASTMAIRRAKHDNAVARKKQTKVHTALPA